MVVPSIYPMEPSGNRNLWLSSVKGPGEEGMELFKLISLQYIGDLFSLFWEVDLEFEHDATIKISKTIGNKFSLR